MKNQTLMQYYFEWYLQTMASIGIVSAMDAKFGGQGIKMLDASGAKQLAPNDIGLWYFDLFDLGEFDQRTIRTKCGFKTNIFNDQTLKTMSIQLLMSFLNHKEALPTDGTENIYGY